MDHVNKKTQWERPIKGECLTYFTIQTIFLIAFTKKNILYYLPLFFNLEDENLPLPSGWEMRIGPSGFIYYVDHVAKKSQWERPIRGK